MNYIPHFFWHRCLIKGHTSLLNFTDLPSGGHKKITGSTIYLRKKTDALLKRHPQFADKTKVWIVRVKPLFNSFCIHKL